MPITKKRLEALEKQQELFPKYETLPEICFLLKMSVDGSGEAITNKDTDDVVNMLKSRIRTWDKNCNSKRQKKYDEAIKNLVIETLKLVKYYRGKQ